MLLVKGLQQAAVVGARNTSADLLPAASSPLSTSKLPFHWCWVGSEWLQHCQSLHNKSLHMHNQAALLTAAACGGPCHERSRGCCRRGAARTAHPPHRWPAVRMPVTNVSGKPRRQQPHRGSSERSAASTGLPSSAAFVPSRCRIPTASCALRRRRPHQQVAAGAQPADRHRDALLPLLQLHLRQRSEQSGPQSKQCP